MTLGRLKFTGVNIVAKYLELKNDNGVTVITDEYPLPCLLSRTLQVTDYQYPTRTQVKTFYTNWTCNNTRVVKSASTLRGLGFNLDDTEDSLKLIRKNLISFYRSTSGVGVFANCVINITNGMYTLNSIAKANALGVEVEVCIFCLNPKILMPSPIGGHFKDANGNTVFDFMRGALQVIGTMQGPVNLGQQVAASYLFNIPNGLDTNNVFLSARSGLPFYSAYRITASGVSWNYTSFEPVISFTSTQMTVNLVRQRSFAGDNSSYSYGGYYENVAYVVQPRGVYL